MKIAFGLSFFNLCVSCLLVQTISSRSVLFWAYLVNVYLFDFQVVLFCFGHIWWMSTYLAFKSFCFVLTIFGECLLIWLSSRSVLFWAYLVNIYLFCFQVVLFCFEHIWWMSTYLAFKSFCSVLTIFGEGNSRNELCTLNFICTFLYLRCLIQSEDRVIILDSFHNKK